MSLMADPMVVLRNFQQQLNTGDPIDPRLLEESYLKMYDEPNGGRRYSYAKIIDGEAQALSIFGLENPIGGLQCYSIGYAVSERHRGRGLAVEAVNRGLVDLEQKLGVAGTDRFYLEAVINVTNRPSIKVSEKLFSDPGEQIIETYSGERALRFKRLIIIKRSVH